MKNNIIIKISGVLAIVSILFFPIAGCGPINITGIDFFQAQEIDVVIKLIVGCSLLAAVAVIILKDQNQTFVAAIVGLILLVAAYFVAKSKMKPNGNDFMDMSGAITLKSGAYLSVIGFVVAAIVSKLNHEVLGNSQSSETVEPKNDHGL